MSRGRPARATEPEILPTDTPTPEGTGYAVEVFDVPETSAQQALELILAELRTPKVYAGMGTKINVGNYENVDVSFGVSGIPIDASDEYVAAAKAKAIGKIESLLEPMFEELADRIEGVKRAYGIA